MAVTLVDAHVHFYECYSLRRFLEDAWNNLTAASNESVPKNQRIVGCLLLAEVGSGSSMEGLRRQASALPPTWRLESTAEPDSLVVKRGSQEIMALIAGRQIVTREGLEVLALATGSDIGETRSLTDSVMAIDEAQGLAVFPWGFGKWAFQRGKILANFIASWIASSPIRVYLGDSAGRIQKRREPGLLRWARQVGVPILAGSDPLPLRHHTGRAGSYGVIMPGDVDFQQPAAWIRKQVQSLATQPQFFGGCSTSIGFLRDQIALRLPRRRER